MALPTRGQPDWDDELNNEIQRLDGDVQSAKADATSAKSTAVSAQNNAAAAANSAAQSATSAQVAADAANKPTADTVDAVLADANSAASQRIAGAYDREAQAAKHDHAYRTWDALVGDLAATPGLHIFGHSVVAGSGATDQPHTFPRLLKSRIEAARTGAKVTKYGMPGASTTAMVTAGTDGEFASHAAGSVGCLVVMAMLNDYSAGINPATTRANLEQIIASYRAHAAAAPNMTVVLVAEWLRQTASGGYPWSDYVAVAQAVADADEYVTLVNLYDRMGQAQGDTLGLYSDGTHPTNKGHALVADLLYADIMRVVPARPVAPATFLPCIVPPVASTSWRSYSNGVTGSTAYGNYVRSSDGPQGASITYQFVGDAGFYTIGLAHRQGPDRGKYDLYIDGVLQGAGGTWEGYAASVADVVQEVANFSVPRSGLHTVKLAMNAKHTSSTGYTGAISALTFTRTGPLTT